MSKNDLTERLRGILISDFDIQPEQIHPEAHLYDDLGMDSIDAVDIMQQIGELSDKRLSPDQFSSIATVGDFLDLLSARMD